MEPINPTAIKRLLNDGQPVSEECSRLSKSYAEKVAEQLTKMFAGNPARPDGESEEWRVMVATWTEAVQGKIPEHRFVEMFIHARRNRNSNFPMDVSEVCAAWDKTRESERYSTPRIGQYDYRGTNICPSCHSTGTRLFEKRDPVLGRDYTYGKACQHEAMA